MRVTVSSPTLVVLPLSLLSSLHRIEGKLQTIFVDDTKGDSLTGAIPAFLPSEAGFSQGPLCQGCGDSWCQGCGLEPDPNQVYGGTWMVATHFKNDPAKYITFDFVGTEVSVFCIVPNVASPSNIVTRYSLDFRIDLDLPPSPVPTYDHVSDNNGGYQYNVSVFHQAGLPNQKHTMMIRAMRSDIDTVLLFDYATYVHDDGLPETLTSIEASSPPKLSTSQATTSKTPVNTTPTQSTSTTTSFFSSSSTLSSTTSVLAHNQTSTQTSSTSPLSTILPTTTFPSSLSSSLAATSSTTIPSPQGSSSSPRHPNQLPIILGSILGAILVLLLLALLNHRLQVRRRRISDLGSHRNEALVNPFSQQAPSISKNRDWGKSSSPPQAVREEDFPNLALHSAPFSGPSTAQISPDGGEIEEGPVNGVIDEPPVYTRDGFQFN
ncbi:hypothetical protein L218DRAFT_985512 [Marasmius fiardii PR-910]|nr:hypothetical protein L218DRAFT_985512 [Marasmius fiardii PR-910]